MDGIVHGRTDTATTVTEVCRAGQSWVCGQEGPVTVAVVAVFRCCTAVLHLVVPLQDQTDRSVLKIDAAFKMLVVPVPEFGISKTNEPLRKVLQAGRVGCNGDLGG
ncbi:hypothetical protein ABZT03_07925 [Streptomyces sp. NPDC005574]|uniref:hypothetical protein n=1 Tax=Streptomyces sp. NPDC005574 TaxID=3156891 RepID=UPI0033ABA577